MACGHSTRGGAKGATPVVRRTGNPFSVNAMSAISTRGRMHFMVFTESKESSASVTTPRPRD
jgi:hypothetical protein